MKNRTRIALAMLLATATPAAASANLLTNGSFETPAVPAGGLAEYTPGTNLGGWIVINTPVAALGGFSEPGYTYPAQDGSISLDLTGIGTRGAGGVQQTVDLATGNYLLSFWIGNDDGPTFSQPTSVELFVNGASQGSFTNSDVTAGTINWRNYTFDLASIGGATTIGFVNRTSTNDNGAFFDNVSLVAAGTSAVPEPATWAMMIAGFGAVGASMRGRRLTAAFA